MKNKSLFFSLALILFFSCTNLVAQNGSVKGVVIEKYNRQPVELANVVLLKGGDSAIVAGVFTKKNGAFDLHPADTGHYILKVLSLGHQTYYSRFFIGSKEQAINLDTLALTLTEQLLTEILVTGKKLTLANKLDKQTFRADQFESAKGGSAIDVLKNLPSISVNSAGEISVRGSNGFLVLMNGKPVLTDAQTVLSQLPANLIENIELITAPSARYDADGKAGIINITTKKSAINALAFQSNYQLGLPATTDYNNLENPLRFGGDASLSFNKNKWDISVSANYTRNDANGKREGDVFTKNFSRNILTRFPSEGERSFDRYNYGVRTGIAFMADKKNIFNAGFFISKKYQQRRADIVYNNTVSDLSTGLLLRRFTYFNSNLQTKEGKFILGSFDYTHIFSNQSALTATAIYEYAGLSGNTLNWNLDFPAKTSIFQMVTNPYTNPIKGYRLKLDYSTMIGKGKLETGYQLRHDQQDGRFDYTVNPPSNQPDLILFSGTAASVNNIHSYYAQYSAKKNKLQYITALRYEYAKRELRLSSDSKPHQLNLHNLFPSANILYNLHTGWDVKAGYSKRVQRNNNFELNPIPEREHSETLEQGDPDLLPQFIDLAELGITHSFSKGSFFSTVYYQQIKNPVQRVNSVFADTILNRLFTNAGKARLLGLEIGSTYKPLRWLSAYLGANMYHYNISGGLDVLGDVSTVNNTDWVYSINFNATFDLGKKWSLQPNANYLSARPTAQGEDSRFFSPNMSLKKTSKDNRFSIGLQWQNMNLGLMNANQQRITTWGKNFFTTTNYIYETDVILLNFSYNLRKLNSKTKLPSSEIGEKEF